MISDKLTTINTKIEYKVVKANISIIVVTPGVKGLSKESDLWSVLNT